MLLVAVTTFTLHLHEWMLTEPNILHKANSGGLNWTVTMALLTTYYHPCLPHFVGLNQESPRLDPLGIHYPNN